MAENFPKETGGGWYELSNGESVQGKDAAQEQEDALQQQANEGAAPTGDDNTGLEDLAVDREVSDTGEGETIGDDEDDPRRSTPVAGQRVIGRAETGEPIIAGGVPTMTTGRGVNGTTDPDLGVAASSAAALADHEARRDEWMQKDEADYDGSPADRLKVRGQQNPTDGGDATNVDD